MSKWMAHIGWDEVPHLSANDKADLMATLPPHQREARSKGIPSLGSGLIYPIAESAITVRDFEIPPHYKRAWALDVGWQCTAALWGAIDTETDIEYVYASYKRGLAEPETHAAAIKKRGAWIPGVGDAAATSQMDGRKMLDIYRKEHGLDLELAQKSVESGIYAVWLRLNNGTLKIFSSLGNLFDEFRFYARDDKGRIVKKDDHLMDCLRYLVMSGFTRAKQLPVEDAAQAEMDRLERYVALGTVSTGWMRA